MKSKKITNYLFIAVLAWVFYMRAPAVLNHFKFQDKVAPNFSVATLEGPEFNLNNNSKKLVIVFWATWCGPCEVELKRINTMITEKRILPTDVLAISSQEDLQTVKLTVKKENYLFNVGIDADGSVSKKFNVSATPTIVFIDQKNSINWMTSGISPTLDYRISSFLK